MLLCSLRMEEGIWQHVTYMKCVASQLQALSREYADAVK